MTAVRRVVLSALLVVAACAVAVKGCDGSTSRDGASAPGPIAPEAGSRRRGADEQRARRRAPTDAEPVEGSAPSGPEARHPVLVARTPAGDPVAGFVVYSTVPDSDEDLRQWAATGFDGVAELTWLEVGVPASVILSSTATAQTARSMLREIRRPRTEVTVENTLGLTVEVVGPDGRRLGRQGVRFGSAPHAREAWTDGPLVIPAFSMGPPDVGWLALEAIPPEGFVGMTSGRIRLSAPPATRSIRLVLEVRPEAILDVTFQTPDGSPCAPDGSNVTMGSQALERPESQTAYDRGKVRIDGLPVFPGESFVVHGWMGSRFEQSGASDPIPAARGVSSATVTLRPTGPWYEDTIISEHDSDYESFCDDAGTVAVSVRDRHGRPASGVEVTVPHWRRALTDDAGCVTLDGLGPERHEITAWAPGFGAATGTVELVAGATSRLVLVEGRSREVTVRVVDHEGAAVPMARVRVRHGGNLDYAHLDDDGVLTPAVFTGPTGAVRLPGLPPANVTVLARFGSRETSAQVGEAPDLLLTLPPPASIQPATTNEIEEMSTPGSSHQGR